MRTSFKVGNLVRRRVDGVIMVIVGGATLRLANEGWRCAWMDGPRRHADEFTEHEFEHYEPNTIEGSATEIDMSPKLIHGGKP